MKRLFLAKLARIWGIRHSSNDRLRLECEQAEEAHIYWPQSGNYFLLRNGQSKTRIPEQSRGYGRLSAGCFYETYESSLVLSFEALR